MKPYDAIIFRPTQCCKSNIGIGLVRTVFSLLPNDNRFICGTCQKPHPTGEVMAVVDLYGGCLPFYRLKRLDSPEEECVEQPESEVTA